MKLVSISMRLIAGVIVALFNGCGRPSGTLDDHESQPQVAVEEIVLPLRRQFKLRQTVNGKPAEVWWVGHLDVRTNDSGNGIQVSWESVELKALGTGVSAIPLVYSSENGMISNVRADRRHISFDLNRYGKGRELHVIASPKPGDGTMVELKATGMWWSTSSNSHQQEAWDSVRGRLILPSNEVN